MFSGAGAAYAWDTNPGSPGGGSHSGGGNSSGGSQSSGSGGTQSGSGSAGTEQVRNCFLYASSSGFGLTCVSGGSATGSAPTVKALLGDQVDDALCWDTEISPADLASKYGIVTDPSVGIPSYVHTCITGLNPALPLYSQSKAQINQTIYEIAKPCDQPPPYKTDQAGQCVRTLTATQKQIADALDNQGGQIPNVVLTRQPNAQVRTNQQVTYVDAPLNPDGTSVTRTSTFTAQGVTLYATRTAFKIYPYGPGTSPVISCSGASQAASSTTGACNWPYPKSSADQPNQAYPFRTEADWTVWVNDGTGARPWKSFQKYDDLQLPVYDVQTLVVGG
ncbi:MAG: hypothetical protein J0H43_07330 [Actinobacteria bacterium]|nr:hypothetical protein [Actinomycetota bacterium]